MLGVDAIAVMLAEGSWLGLGGSALALTAVWWAAVCYAWEARHHPMSGVEPEAM